MFLFIVPFLLWTQVFIYCLQSISFCFDTHCLLTVASGRPLSCLLCLLDASPHHVLLAGVLCHDETHRSSHPEDTAHEERDWHQGLSSQKQLQDLRYPGRARLESDLTAACLAGGAPQGPGHSPCHCQNSTHLALIVSVLTYYMLNGSKISLQALTEMLT